MNQIKTHILYNLTPPPFFRTWWSRRVAAARLAWTGWMSPTWADSPPSPSWSSTSCSRSTTSTTVGESSRRGSKTKKVGFVLIILVCFFYYVLFNVFCFVFYVFCWFFKCISLIFFMYFVNLFYVICLSFLCNLFIFLCISLFGYFCLVTHLY